MIIKLALVYFPTEKAKYVVSVEDVSGLSAKHFEDFDAEKLYDVNWPVLRRENSSPTTKSVPYKGRVLLLATSRESMISRAMKLKIRLPPAYAEATCKPTVVPDCAAMTKRASKRSKKQVEKAMVSECQKRMTAIMTNHLQSDTNDTGENLNEPLDNVNDTSKSSVNDGLLKDKTADHQLNFAEPDLIDDSPVVSQEKEPAPNNISDGGNEGNSRFPKLNQKQTGKKDYSDDTTEGSCSYISSSGEITRLSNQVVEIQSKLTVERKKSRSLQAQLDIANGKIRDFSKCFNEFTIKGQKFFSADNEDVATPRKPQPASILKSVRCSPRVSNWVETTLDRSTRSSPIDSVKRNIFKENEQDNQGSPLKKRKTSERSTDHRYLSSPIDSVKRKISKGSPAKSDKSIVRTRDPIRSPVKSDNSPVKKLNTSIRSPIPTKSEGSPVKKQQKKKSSVERPSLGPDEKDNRVLGAMILKALEGETNLQDNGTHVNIGNNTWVKKKLWDEKFAKKSAKISVVVKDLAEEIWGFRKCAEMSLTGGKSPKNPGAEIKPAAPVGAMEAILGVFRAKMMQQGITVEHILDDMVEERGKNKFLREKFQDAAKKVKKEKTAA